MTLSAAIELPDDKDKRAALFEWVNKWHAEHNRQAPRMMDVGQRFLLVRLGL